jgi:hypothetical protein
MKEFIVDFMQGDVVRQGTVSVFVTNNFIWNRNFIACIVGEVQK